METRIWLFWEAFLASTARLEATPMGLAYPAENGQATLSTPTPRGAMSLLFPWREPPSDRQCLASVIGTTDDAYALPTTGASGGRQPPRDAVRGFLASADA